MKYIIKIVMFLFTTLLFAQYPDTIYGTDKTRKTAKEITNTYNAQLGLSGLQLPLFQDKVEDYIVLSEKAKKEYEGKAELNALTKLAVKESLEMQDILTRTQYNVYKIIRQDIQPIKVVESNEK